MSEETIVISEEKVAPATKDLKVRVLSCTRISAEDKPECYSCQAEESREDELAGRLVWFNTRKDQTPQPDKDGKVQDKFITFKAETYILKEMESENGKFIKVMPC